MSSEKKDDGSLRIQSSENKKIPAGKLEVISDEQDK